VPANLTPQYHAAEDRYRDAKTAEEKETALQEMLALIPKHKGPKSCRRILKNAWPA